MFFFLLRNPHNTIVSHYNRLPAPVDDVISDVLSYEKLQLLYETISQHASNRTFIINSESLLENPREEVEDFCNKARIAFFPERLHWSPLEPTFQESGETFHVTEHCKFSRHWNENAVTSSGFNKRLLSPVKVDGSGNPTFEEIPLKHRHNYELMYHTQKVHYELLSHEFKKSNRSKDGYASSSLSDNAKKPYLPESPFPHKKIRGNGTDSGFFPSPTFPMALKIYVSPRKITGPRVAEALEIIEAKEGSDKAKAVGIQFLNWAKFHNRHFNISAIQSLIYNSETACQSEVYLTTRNGISR